MLTIALFSDKAMLPGTHVTLASLLQNSTTPLQVILFANRIPDAEKQLLLKTFELSNKHGASFTIRDFKPTATAGANALHGNITTYGRLSLPNLLPKHPSVIYLDCDLVVAGDIAKMISIPDNKVLVADGMGRRASTVDRQLFVAAKLDLEGPYFNAGVLGINLARWRGLDISLKCQTTIHKYPKMFKSADQAVLNVDRKS